MSLLSWVVQSWTRHSGCLTRAEQSRRITSPSPLAMLCLMVPRMLLIFFAMKAHPSPGPPGSFLKLLPSWPAPSLNWCMASCFFPQEVHFVFPAVEFHEVLVYPLLKTVEVPLKSSTTLWSTKYSSQFCVTCRFSEDIFCPTIQVCNEDIGKYWPQYQHLEYTFRNGPSTKLFATDYNSLNLAFESVVNPLHCPLI